MTIKHNKSTTMNKENIFDILMDILELFDRWAAEGATWSEYELDIIKKIERYLKMHELHEEDYDIENFDSVKELEKHLI